MGAEIQPKKLLAREEEAAHKARFYQIVLSWDFFRILHEAHKRKEEKEKEKEKGETTDEDLRFRKVKDSYTDVEDYISTYEPLLFEEVKSLISKDKDQWGAGKTTCVKECKQDKGFHIVTVCVDMDEGMDKEKRVKNNDLVLLSKPLWSKSKVPEENYAFAVVEGQTKESIMLRMYLAGEVRDLNTDVIHDCPRLAKVRSLVTSDGEGDRLFDLSKICSLSTITCEYIALRSIGSLPFMDLILAPSEENLDAEAQAWKVSGPLEEYIKDNLNESQQKAIQVGLSRKPFILIQGPPGTGKTQTILALLSAILHAIPARVKARVSLLDIKQKPKSRNQEKFNHWRIASPWLSGSNPREKTMPVNGDDGFFPTTRNEFQPEVVSSIRKYRLCVLVCAPSNSALDEIVLRVMNNGVRDESDRSYSPKIVRIGLKPHHSIRPVFINELVERKKRSMGGAKLDGDDALKAAILEEAVIVFSTLSSSHPSHFKRDHGFDVVIIDEAAQAVEPATLLPLTNGCQQVFLIGDPVQLPATVSSTVARKFGYERSMFERFQRAGYPVTMLKMQYRMHPEIRKFPSEKFYGSSLEDGPNIKEQTKRSWHEYRCFGPFCFFDLHEGKEAMSEASGSWVNADEVEFVLNLYHKLVSRYPELKSSNYFAIISPYRAQVDLLKECFKSTFGVDSEKEVEITTLDGCQFSFRDVKRMLQYFLVSGQARKEALGMWKIFGE
uniref:probable helicase MAGATAMA 3 isoform X1 n=1 Tax=Fragaria vesca subsp. vesca TaxID=101020 RepID=UPI0005C942C7|nr:PREDICTED: probable helicase MAGATAMA 3 isoform X1 [Fragaria vesca subsp. vesca]